MNATQICVIVGLLSSIIFLTIVIWVFYMHVSYRQKFQFYLWLQICIATCFSVLALAFYLWNELKPSTAVFIWSAAFFVMFDWVCMIAHSEYVWHLYCVSIDVEC